MFKGSKSLIINDNGHPLNLVTAAIDRTSAAMVTVLETNICHFIYFWFKRKCDFGFRPNLKTSKTAYLKPKFGLNFSFKLSYSRRVQF